MKKIVIKEIDRFYSITHRNKYISEYFIYVLSDKDVRLDVVVEIGEDDKKIRVNELLVKYFINESNYKINKKELIEEIGFEKIKI